MNITDKDFQHIGRDINGSIGEINSFLNKILKQYLHLSNLNEKIQVSGNLKFLDLIDEAILEEKTSINEKIKNI